MGVKWPAKTAKGVSTGEVVWAAMGAVVMVVGSIVKSKLSEKTHTKTCGDRRLTQQ